MYSNGLWLIRILICSSHNRNVCSLNWKLDENFLRPGRFFHINANQQDERRKKILNLMACARSCLILFYLFLLHSFLSVSSSCSFLIYWMLHLKSWRFNLRNYDIHSFVICLNMVNFNNKLWWWFLNETGSFWWRKDVSRHCLWATE